MIMGIESKHDDDHNDDDDDDDDEADPWKQAAQSRERKWSRLQQPQSLNSSGIAIIQGVISH